jgi:hypothetical protein
VQIGKAQEIKISNIAVAASPFALFGDNKNFDTVEANNVNIEPEILAGIGAWSSPQGPQALTIKRLRMKGVTVATRGVEIPQFEADIAMGPDGKVQKATLTDGKLKVELAPKDSSMQVALSASAWKSFIGPAVEFDELTANGVVEKNQATFSDYVGRVGGGEIKGKMKVTWSGPIRVDGDFKLENGRLNQLLPQFTRNFTASGALNLTANFAASDAKIESLFSNARLDGAFSIANGELSNIDVSRALQQPGNRGGRTRFDSLSGSLQMSGNQYSYRDLKLSSGALSANGAVDIAANGALSGRVNAEISTRGNVAARGSMGATGTVRDPVLR